MLSFMRIWRHIFMKPYRYQLKGFPFSQVFRCEILGSQSGTFTVNVFIIFYRMNCFFDPFSSQSITFFSSSDLLFHSYPLPCSLPPSKAHLILLWKIFLIYRCMWLSNLYMEFYIQCYFVDLLLFYLLVSKDIFARYH